MNVTTQNFVIGPRSEKLIEDEETGGAAFYQARESHTDWPGGASGVTIAIGYDCGYETADQIAADWSPYLSFDMVQHLKACAGVRGAPARSLAHELASKVTVPWLTALAMFKRRDLPKWIATVCRDLANVDKISSECLGVLTSIAFNRGDSWNITASRDPHGRYSEMRAIKANMALGRFADIPANILAMRRLWPIGRDLYKRRNHEAALFVDGLKLPAPPIGPLEPAPPAVA